jgi:aminoglycoside phosphotransferase (APT) family kinase protein
MTVDTSVGDVVDLAAVSRWMRRSGLGDGAIENPVLLAGGTQNVLVRFRWCGGEFVLRRPPLRPRPKNNELILREAVVLKALASTTIPHARLLGTCDDPEVLGSAVFYVMEAVEGFNPAEDLPSAWCGPEGRDRIVFAATDALADIGSLDHEAIGLADFGKPVGFLERQVDRWVGERERYLTLDGYRGEALPGYEALRDYLAARVPSTFKPGLMHGDYHFGNLLFDENTGDLVAVLDWEMATIGDPLLDLGRYLAMLPDQHETIIEAGGIWNAGPLPSPTAVVERYSERRCQVIQNLTWYVLMGCFKLGIILEGTYARSCAGLVPQAIGATMHETASRLFQRASRLQESQ